MKTCPHCDTRYSDDTLQFCLQDGTPLIGPAARDTPTVVLTEDETVARGGGQWQQSQVTHVAPATVRKGANTAVAVAITAVAMLFLFVIAGVTAWLVIGNGGGPTSNTANLNGSNVPGNRPNTNVPATPTATVPSATPTATTETRPGTNTSTPETPLPPSTDDTQARNDVSQRISNWKSLLEARDLNGYMDNYASTVDYYRRQGSSVAAVRADKARAFTLYSSMRVNISNMSVSVGPSGDTATAMFDKEWSFSGRDTSSGKVRSQLGLRRINGRWLITSERDLRVYYTR